jgi:alpha-glucosidase
MVGEAVIWWQRGPIYQAYPRSFADSDGDGIGDLGGVLERLDHLRWLGVAAVWVGAINASPNRDWGYDVSDYCDVHPDLGGLEAFRALTAESLPVICDVVPNHSSDRHPWFLDEATRHSHYVWTDRPNNWRNWTRAGDRWYLHQYLPEQPDLNWHEPRMHEEFDRIVRFWFDQGAAGLRIDVCDGLYHDAELRDDAPGRRDRSRNQRETHAVLARWRAIADGYDPPRVLLGETGGDTALLSPFFGTPEAPEVHVALDFPFAQTPFNPRALAATVAAVEAALPPHAWPCWQLSSHDVPRFPTRWCEGDPARVRLALTMLFTLRGTPVLYYGDELGMPDTPVRRYDRRDGARTPMPWSPDPGPVEPWLPYGDLAACNVRDQRDDPESVLHFTRRLIALRNQSEDLLSGAYEELAVDDDRWIFRRGERTVVTLDFAHRQAVIA